MNEKEITRISKFLSLVLRHKPETIGIELDKSGWTDVSTLIEKANTANVPLSFELLKHIVGANVKKRFAFTEYFDKIRANQGHSIEVELGYEPKEPPAILYHGTGQKFVSSIQEQGLQKQSRHHVHLSADMETAINVGGRHGKPFVFEVLSGQMYNDNFQFYQANNGVWLTDQVPVKYLKPYSQQ